MPIERAFKTNRIVLSKTPTSVTSVAGKRSDQTFFTGISSFDLSGKTILLRKTFDEYFELFNKVYYDYDFEDFKSWAF